MKFVIVLGELASGFQFVGPFASEAEALRWQAANAAGEKWQIVALLSPV